MLVTINYRLGVFGFFSASRVNQNEIRMRRNGCGLMDQIAALRWNPEEHRRVWRRSAPRDRFRRFSWIIRRYFQPDEIARPPKVCSSGRLVRVARGWVFLSHRHERSRRRNNAKRENG